LTLQFFFANLDVELFTWLCRNLLGRKTPA